MTSLSNKTYWLIGASDGIGYSLAKKMDELGASLVISSRNREGLEQLGNSLKNNARIVTCDVTDLDSVSTAFSSIGNIDGLVYMAGYYAPMYTHDWNHDEVLKIADTNFMGALRVLGVCLPDFIKRNEGHIVIVGSLAGFTGLQGAIGYGASKAALMHLSENLSADLYRTNVKVQLFNPGFVKTKLTLKNKFFMPFIISTEKAAIIIANGMLGSRRVINFPWFFSLVFRIGRILPIKYLIFGKR